MSDLETGVDAPEDDLRAQLTAAMAGEVEKAPAPAATPELDELDGIAEKAAADRARDEAGRFAKKQEEAKASEAPAEQKAPSEAAPVDPAAPEIAVRPPHGWNPEAKAAFDALPPAVKDAVARREQEVNAGFAKLAEYKGIEPFVEMAKNGGTTITQALQQYVGIEQELRRDFLSGVSRICQNSGVDPVALANAILARNGGGNQNAPAGTEQRAHQPAPIDPRAIVNEALTAFEARQQQAAVQGQIEAFKADPKNLYFENVRPQMAKIMNAGLATTLQEAYDAACWQTPEIRNLLINQQGNGQAAAAQQAARATQARQASKSVTGSPSAGVATSKGPASSLRAELEQAFASSGSRA